MNVDEIQCGFNEITTPKNEKRNLLLGWVEGNLHIFFRISQPVFMVGITSKARRNLRETQLISIATSTLIQL
jgi:hypothetical protein